MLSPATSRPPSPVTTKKVRPEAGQSGFFANGGPSLTPDVIAEEDIGVSIRRRGNVNGGHGE